MNKTLPRLEIESFRVDTDAIREPKVSTYSSRRKDIGVGEPKSSLVSLFVITEAKILIGQQ